MHGRLEVVCGPMFSGKTEEMIRRLRRAVISELGVQVFVPALDTRHGVGRVVSHANTDLEKYNIQATALDNVHSLSMRVRPNIKVIGLDEAQFFDNAALLLAEIDILLGRGVRVIVAGLDRDAHGIPFGPMPKLLAHADEVTKLTAICSMCKEDNATMSYRTVPTNDQILVGGSDRYEARCRSCHAKA